MITDPAKKMTITLDHLKKEAHIHTGVPAKPEFHAPHMELKQPQFKVPAPPADPLNVRDLGKRWLQGYEVVGKEYTYPPVKLPEPPAPPEPPAAPKVAGMPQVPGAPKLPDMPKAPAMPKVPDLPKVPGMAEMAKLKAPELPKAPSIAGAPKLPEAPKVPKAPEVPKAPDIPKAPLPPPSNTVAEVWTSPLLNLPMLTRTKGSFGQMISHCRKAMPGEPPPSVFQIPPEYKQFHVPPPGMPAPPAAPAVPPPPPPPKFSV